MARSPLDSRQITSDKPISTPGQIVGSTLKYNDPREIGNLSTSVPIRSCVVEQEGTEIKIKSLCVGLKNYILKFFVRGKMRGEINCIHSLYLLHFNFFCSKYIICVKKKVWCIQMTEMLFHFDKTTKNIFACD